MPTSTSPETGVRPGEGNIEPFAPTDEPVSNLKPARSTKGETAEAKADREKAVREAYAAAGKRLREENLERFNQIHEEEAAKRGYAWKPRPSKVDKAAEQLALLLEEYPELASRLKS